MKVITVRQPWAYAIIHMGKDIENRTWNTGYRGPLLIHAASTMRRSEYDCFTRFIRSEFRRKQILPPTRLPMGGIVGMVELVDVVKTSKSR